MTTHWTCPTCGTERGDCESGHGNIASVACKHDHGFVMFDHVNDDKLVGHTFECVACKKTFFEPLTQDEIRNCEHFWMGADPISLAAGASPFCSRCGVSRSRRRR